MPEPKYVYRGVHAGHPAVDAARQGIVFPGDIEETITPEEHNSGGVSRISPYTSWTFDESVAKTHAADFGAGGVVLRLPMNQPPEGAPWSRVESPNQLSWEREILLLGVRIDAEVIYGEQSRNRLKENRRRTRG